MASVSPISRYWLPVLSVTAIHVALLAGLWSGASASPPVVQVMDVAVINVAEEVPPQPRPEPKPQPRPEPPKKKETPRPEPRPEPVPQPQPSPEPAPAPAEPPPPAPAPAAPAEPAPVITPPRVDASYRGNTAPSYPAASRRLREEGKVLLRIFVKADGSVGEVVVSRSSGHARLDDAAVQAVKRWKLIPARRGSEPFATWYTLPIEFNLEK